MLKILFDQNFNHRILRGLRQRIPDLDAVTTQALKREKETDTDLLHLAYVEERVLITHDQKTFPKYAYKRLMEGNSISGVIIVPNNMPIGDAITELEFYIKCSSKSEFENRVEFLPLGLTS